MNKFNRTMTTLDTARESFQLLNCKKVTRKTYLSTLQHVTESLAKVYVCKFPKQLESKVEYRKLPFTIYRSVLNNLNCVASCVANYGWSLKRGYACPL